MKDKALHATYSAKLSQVYHLPHKKSGYQIDRQFDHEWILRLLVCGTASIL